MSSLFKQSCQTVGIKLGRLPCIMETLLEQHNYVCSTQCSLTKWSFEGICYLTLTSAHCSSHIATYIAEGAAVGRKRRQSTESDFNCVMMEYGRLHTYVHLEWSCFIWRNGCLTVGFKTCLISWVSQPKPKVKTSSFWVISKYSQARRHMYTLFCVWV